MNSDCFQEWIKYLGNYKKRLESEVFRGFQRLFSASNSGLYFLVNSYLKKYYLDFHRLKRCFSLFDFKFLFNSLQILFNIKNSNTNNYFPDFDFLVFFSSSFSLVGLVFLFLLFFFGVFFFGVFELFDLPFVFA